MKSVGDVEATTWRDRLRYRFDTWMARGTVAIMALLGAATLAFVLVVALVVGVFEAYPDQTDTGFWDIAWGNLMRTLDPGTMGGDSGWRFRVLMLTVTIGGLVIVASLIGIVSGAFDDKMIELRKGRSRVIESDHTVILGWNNQLFTILSELCQANASRRRSTIVVLADLDKVEMEDEIRAKVTDTGNTSIICRRGNPHAPLDVELTSPTTARSIVVLPSDDDRHPDMTAIKSVLALTQVSADVGPTVIAELRDASNLDAARVAGRGRARWVLAGQLINRMTVQTCLQPGLSAVCTELLDFAGDEIYFTRQPDLDGSTYLDAQLSLADSALIGIAREDKIFLNPPGGDFLEAGDQLIVIATDNAAISVSSPGVPDASVLAPVHDVPAQPERTLVLGYNHNIQGMLEDLAGYVSPGSSVTLVADVDDPVIHEPEGLMVETLRADTANRRTLEALQVETFDHILVLAYRDLLDAQSADAKTLVTLLHLRDIADRGGFHLSIVSEMLDDRNRELAEVTRPDDFIVSDRLASLMIAQVSENRSLISVFEQLFTSGGSEVYLRPAEHFVTTGAETDFYSVVAAASRRGETAIGYRVEADVHSRHKGYGVHLNPDKRDRRTFARGDSVILLAEQS